MSSVYLRTDLAADPRVIRIGELCGGRRALQVIGPLYWLWAVAASQSHDGNLTLLSPKQIDRETCLKGFAAAMIAVGWLEELPGGGVRIPDYDKYFISAKTREQGRIRAARHRWTQKNNGGKEPSESVTLSRSERDTSVTPARGRDRDRGRGGDEEEMNPPLPPAEPGGPKGGARASVGEIREVANDATWDRERAIRGIVGEFPPSNGMPSPAKVRDALYRLGGTSVDARFQSEAVASRWLLGRVKAYAASPLCQTTPARFRPSMARWFGEGMFDTDDSAWAGRYDTRTDGGAAGAVTDDEISRIARGERVT